MAEGMFGPMPEKIGRCLASRDHLFLRNLVNLNQRGPGRSIFTCDHRGMVSRGESEQQRCVLAAGRKWEGSQAPGNGCDVGRVWLVLPIVVGCHQVSFF